MRTLQINTGKAREIAIKAIRAISAIASDGGNKDKEQDQLPARRAARDTLQKRVLIVQGDNFAARSRCMEISSRWYLLSGSTRDRKRDLNPSLSASYPSRVGGLTQFAAHQIQRTVHQIIQRRLPARSAVNLYTSPTSRDITGSRQTIIGKTG